jgi:hypothetical protein
MIRGAAANETMIRGAAANETMTRGAAANETKVPAGPANGNASRGETASDEDILVRLVTGNL